ncbi:hypothetical protein GQ457_01G001110 [Hibiscus cannabinus]
MHFNMFDCSASFVRHRGFKIAAPASYYRGIDDQVSGLRKTSERRVTSRSYHHVARNSHIDNQTTTNTKQIAASMNLLRLNRSSLLYLSISDAPPTCYLPLQSSDPYSSSLACSVFSTKGLSWNQQLRVGRLHCLEMGRGLHDLITEPQLSTHCHCSRLVPLKLSSAG